MTPSEREQIRLSLLRYLDAAAVQRFGIAVAVLTQHLRAEGFDVRSGDVFGELVYLKDKGLVERIDKTISPENLTWRITAAGRDEYAQLIA